MNDQPKLGELLIGGEKRDAVHIAIAPVVAGESLLPGDHVGFLVDGTVGEQDDPTKNIGIVDPFLRFGIRKGKEFWLFLYPNTVTSLRHVWTHSAFTAQHLLEKHHGK